MGQFIALLWLKWKLALSQLRTPRALYGQLALGVLGLAVFVMAVLASVGIFISLSMLSLQPGDRLAGMTLHAMLILYLSSFYLMWVMVAIVPTRGGGSFELGLLLHYPLPLPRLFALDVSSEMLKGVALPMLLPLLMVHLSVPMVQGRALWGLLPFGMSLVLGALIIRFIELLIARVSQRGKSSGEAASALGGVLMVALILGASILSARFMMILERSHGIDGMLMRALPMSLTGKAILAAGRGDMSSYLTAIGGLSAWIGVLLPSCYLLWRQMALGQASGGGEEGPAMGLRPAWLLPRLGELRSALLEQQLKYLFRNSQVKALLALSLALVLVRVASRMPGSVKPSDRWLLELMSRAQILQGADMAMMMAYVALFYFALFNNLFGLDSGGFRTLVLAPIPRREILLTRNLALSLLMGLQGLVLLLVCALLFRDVGLEDICVVGLSLGALVPVLAGVGNLCSIYFPRRSVFGEKISCSPWALLLLLVEIPLGIWPLGLGFYAALVSNSLWMKYGIMTAGALVSLGLYYKVLLPAAVTALEARELEVLQTVTGGDE